MTALTDLRFSRRLVALLAALLLCSVVVLGSPTPPAGAQSSLIEPAQTKKEAAAAEKAADAAASSNDGGSVPLVVWLGLASLVVIGTAAYFILRDARVNAGPADPRAAPRQPIDRSSVRGAPKTMFTGEGAAGGQSGRSKKRAKGKRQKAARRNNR